MFFKGLKANSNKKYLNKLLSERRLNVTDSKVESLGVILNADEFSDVEAFKKLGDFIKVHPNKLKVVLFSEGLDEDLKSWDLSFSTKNFGWNGAIDNVELKTFLDKDFDVLISYYKADKLELKLVTALSKAKFKIGVLQEDERLNDLIIKTRIDEFDVFKSEIFKYLTILNKIRNEQ